MTAIKDGVCPNTKDSNAHNQLQEKFSKFVLLALDKSDYIKDTTQLLIFIHMEYATTFGVS